MDPSGFWNDECADQLPRIHTRVRPHVSREGNAQIAAASSNDAMPEIDLFWACCLAAATPGALFAVRGASGFLIVQGSGR
jgi:hypothetical protein